MNPSFVDQLKKPISLLELRKNLTDKYSNSISWILRILKKTKNGVYEIKYHYSDNEENLNSLIVSQLLSFLYELLEDELTALNREDAPYFKIIITLFVDTFINYYSFMISWFKGDLLRDSFNEFMIKERKNQVATIEKRINWKRDFEFRKSVFLYNFYYF